jgi:magnesium transporter
MALQHLDLKDLAFLKDNWAKFDRQKQRSIFSRLSRAAAEDLFLALPASSQLRILDDLPAGERRLWVRSLALDDTADLVQKAPAEARERILNLLDTQTRREVEGLLAYEEDAAGGLMNPRYLRLRPETTVDAAIRYLRAQARTNTEVIYYAYVLGADQRLLGVVSLRDLLVSPSEKIVKDVMQTDFAWVPEAMDREEVSLLFARQDLLALPVLDREGRMKGLVTHDDIVDVVEKEATEDMHKISGMEALEAPYFQVSFREMLKKRAGWLTVLFLGEMFTATAMSHYEHEIQRAVILALFIPLIISSGGNSGSQASTLIIRSLALREIRLADWWRVFGRELLCGLALGAVLGSIGLVRVVLWQQWSPIYGEHYLLVAATVAFSLVGVVVWGTLSGSMLPFVLRRLGFDPASASAPFVATLVDVTGLIIYFTVASVVLNGSLL